MSRWSRVLELNGTAREIGSDRSLSLPDQLEGRTLLITDFQDSPLGVESLESGTRQIAPVVEKRLRERGEIDEVARLLIHDSERQGNTVRVFYTAVGVSRYLGYRNWSDRHPQHLLLFPLGAALLAVARAQGLENGALVFRHGECVDLLLRLGGRVVHASRLQLFDDSRSEQARIAEAITSLWRQHSSQEEPAVCLVIEERAGAAAGLAEELATRGRLISSEPPLGVASLFSSLSPALADSSPRARALLLGSRIMPWASAAMLALCVLTAVLAWVWRADAQQLEQELAQRGAAAAAPLDQRLESALQEAAALSAQQQELAAFAALVERAERTPNPALLVEQLRKVVPEGMVLTELGVLSEEDGVLVVVAGRSTSAAAPLAAEKRLVSGLESLGYRVVKREIEGDKASLFRLALTWSGR